jgi:hypothetical protein
MRSAASRACAASGLLPRLVVILLLLACAHPLHPVGTQRKTLPVAGNSV